MKGGARTRWSEGGVGGVGIGRKCHGSHEHIMWYQHGQVNNMDMDMDMEHVDMDMNMDMGARRSSEAGGGNHTYTRLAI